MMSNSVSGGVMTTKGVTGKAMPTAGAWMAAAGVIARWLDQRERVERVFEHGEDR